jgi:hypothetical protein
MTVFLMSASFLTIALQPDAHHDGSMLSMRGFGSVRAAERALNLIYSESLAVFA